MPFHKGVKLSIISQIELATHPEFPHPESSQFTYRSPSLKRPKSSSSSHWQDPVPAADSKADRLLGRPSVVAVYIPSVPGSQFWLRYNVVDPEPEVKWYYFKLYMNGRQITSWGINVLEEPEGQIMRGLFQPGQSHNFRTEDGRKWEKGGIEARTFSFGPQARSVAEDGGLIQVQVFRAKGRKRRVQDPTKYKNQQLHGINLPSHDLLDHPEDARFYDWHLKDPVDTPYLDFRFYYRSWDTLKSLHLIPVEQPTRLLPPTPSLMRLQGVCNTAPGLLAEDDDGNPLISYLESLEDEVKSSRVASPAEADSLGSIVANRAWNTTPFDDSPPKAADSPSGGKKRTSRLSFLMPPKSSPFSKKKSDDSIKSLNSVTIPRSRFSSAKIDKSLSPSSDWPVGKPGRPLPKIPERQSSKFKKTPPKEHTRKSSTASSAPSITPSLQSYVDRRESHSPAPPELGVASVLQIVVATPPRKADDSYIEANEQLSDTELSLVLKDPTQFSPDKPVEDDSPTTTSTFASKRCGISSPPPATFYSSIDQPLSNVTVRKTRPGSATKSTPVNGRNSITDPPTLAESTLSLSPGEWMARTPSPICVRKSRLWSPTFVSLRKSVIKENFRLKSQSPSKGRDAKEEDGMMGASIRAREPVQVGPPRLYQPTKRFSGFNEAKAAAAAEELIRGIDAGETGVLGQMPGNWI